MSAPSSVPTQSSKSFSAKTTPPRPPFSGVCSDIDRLWTPHMTRKKKPAAIVPRAVFGERASWDDAALVSQPGCSGITSASSSWRLIVRLQALFVFARPPLFFFLIVALGVMPPIFVFSLFFVRPLITTRGLIIISACFWCCTNRKLLFSLLHHRVILKPIGRVMATNWQADRVQTSHLDYYTYFSFEV